MSATAQVAIVMGSNNDASHVAATTELLDRFGVTWEMQTLSAHRQPEKLHAYVRDAVAGGTKVFIAVAGLSAALPGVIASLTSVPVIGLPVPAGALAGIDALLSMAQMPGGVPVATVGIGSGGSKNAAVLAARILALADERVAKRLGEYRAELERG
jgi:5-(carboxyamino)imidazole ribonucleotide mutase